MKYNLYNFMSIGGNCADLGFLGPNRIKGPVDNVIAKKGLLSTKLLFEHSFMKLFEEIPIIKDWKKVIDSDPGKCYEYENYIYVHNIPTTDKFKENVKKRLDDFYLFYAKVKSFNNYYFVYHVNEYDYNKKTQTVHEQFYKGIEYIKSLGLLDKLIIIQTKNKKLKNTWNYHHKDITKFCDDNNIKNLVFYDNSLYSKNPEKISERFLEQINELLNK